MKQLETWILKYSPRFIVVLTCLAVLLIGVAAFILTQYQPKTACQRELALARLGRGWRPSADQARRLHPLPPGRLRLPGPRAR